jgi:hypothetical protein
MKFVSWRVSALSVVCALALQACGGGGGGGADTKVTPSAAHDQTTTSGVPVQMSVAIGALVSISGSPAQVDLPANGVVDAATQQPVTGNISVKFDVINPAADPHEMANGHYESRNVSTGQPELIESFGAISVDLTQGNTPLQLAKGQKATIRIPVQSRSAARPATIPLYYWDGAKALWVQEGTATLKSDANGAYYEGQVSHFTTWNADRPISESVSIQGCVQTKAGTALASADYTVYTDGQNYSGLAWSTNTGGNFTVLAKKGGQIDMYVRYQGLDRLLTSATADVSTKLPTCFVVDTGTQPANVLNAFNDLTNGIGEGISLAVDSLVTGDSTTQAASAPDKVCASGSVKNLTLNGTPVQGGEKLVDGKTYQVHAEYDACVPMPGPGDTVSASDPKFTGTSDATINTVLNASGERSTTLVNTLSPLADATTGKSGQGTFTIDALLSAPANPQDTQVVTFTPKAGSTLTNTLSKRTLTFVSGTMTSVWINVGSPNPSSRLTYDKLTYTMGGATYVLNGSTTDGKGQYTLSKNGTVISTATYNGLASSATGTVDPF